MNERKLYKRTVTSREPINDYGKLGFVPYVEYVLTDEVSIFNYRKQWKFKECSDPAGYILCKEPDKVYRRKITY